MTAIHETHRDQTEADTITTSDEKHWYATYLSGVPGKSRTAAGIVVEEIMLAIYASYKRA